MENNPRPKRRRTTTENLNDIKPHNQNENRAIHWDMDRKTSKKKNSVRSIYLITIIVLELILILLMLSIAYLYIRNGWIPQDTKEIQLRIHTTPSPTPTELPTPSPTPTATPVPIPTPTPTPIVKYIYVTAEPTYTPSPTPIITPEIRYIYITPEPTVVPTPIVSPTVDMKEDTNDLLTEAEGNGVDNSIASTSTSTNLAHFELFDGEITWKTAENELDTVLQRKGFVASDSELAQMLRESGKYSYYGSALNTTELYGVVFSNAIFYFEEGALSYISLLPTPLANLASNQAETFSSMKEYLIQKYGQPTLDNKQIDGSISESYEWELEDAIIQLGPMNNDNTLEQAEKGETMSTIKITRKTASMATPSPSVTYTPAPTYTPIPIQNLVSSLFANHSSKKAEVEIADAKLTLNSARIPELYIRFKNTSKTETIDRLDLIMECYDSYGDMIKWFGLREQSSFFFEAEKIKPGKTTPVNKYFYTLYGVDGVKSVRVAITRYHTSSGETVEMSEEDYDWKEFRK